MTTKKQQAAAAKRKKAAAAKAVEAPASKATAALGRIQKAAPAVEEESEEDNEEDEDTNDSSSLNSPITKKKVEDEGPIFENDLEELETYRSMELPDGVLRVLYEMLVKQILEMYNNYKLIYIIICFQIVLYLLLVRVS